MSGAADLPARVGASIKDVARAAGVSLGTVSNVLNHPERVGDETRIRVEAAIGELGYVRNGAASQLRARFSRMIGLIVLDLANPFFTAIARGMEDWLVPRGYALMVASTDGDPRREHEMMRTFMEHGVAGLAVVPAGDDLTSARQAAMRGVRIVLVDAADPAGVFASVSTDDVAGSRGAVAHLLGRGARRVVVLGARPSPRQVTDRIAGAREACVAAGLDPDSALDLVPTASLDAAGGQQAMEKWLAAHGGEPPEAIFAINDLLATGAVRTLRRADAYDPAHTPLVGYDDIDMAAELLTPLSSVRRPSRELGASAAQLLVEGALTGGEVDQQKVFVPELMVRESSR